MSKQLLPYVQLMRLDRPHGLLYFYLPHLYGALHGATTTGARPARLSTTAFTLMLATIFVRGAVCSWNDLVDAPFDRQVTRTKNRPIARGAITAPAAMAFIVLQAITAASFLLILPSLCSVYCFPAIIGASIYPFSKRVTNFPQVVCAVTIGWGVMIGEAAMDAAPSLTISKNLGTWRALSPTEKSTIALYLANVAWNLGYEIMYSYQDVEDDVRAGVRSLAVIFKKPSEGKALLWLIAVCQVFCLSICGWYMGCRSTAFHFWLAVGATYYTLYRQISDLKLDQPSSCAWWFARSGIITGSAILCSLLKEYVSRYKAL